MPTIADQRAIRECSKLPFCYLCGNPLKRSERTRDHVPPKAIFAEEDRGVNPLILPAHPQCNTGQSVGDEVIGQLVAIAHGKLPKPGKTKLKFGAIVDDSGKPSHEFLTGHDLRPLIWRFIKGFHAALYREPLVVNGRANVHMPFPEGKQLLNGRVEFSEVLPQQRLITEEIKKNRLVGNLDSVRCFNDQCVYECVWVSDDSGQTLCMFALRLYDWEKLADRQNFTPRGCVGLYSPATGKPRTSTRGTSLIFPVSGEPLDPYDEDP